MSQHGRRFIKRLAIAMAAVAVVAAPAWLAGYRLNESESLPVGIWRLGGADSLARGHVVAFCPPQTTAFAVGRDRGYFRDGSCEDGSEPLFKPIVAMAGDQVEVDADGIRVNGVLLSNSKAFLADGQGRELPQVAPGAYRVAGGQAWVVSTYKPSSFDSRYFGPIPVAIIDAIATPVWTPGASDD